MSRQRAAMYGMDAAGLMEGRGIFKKLGKLIKKGVKKVGKFLKKKKIISKVTKIASPLVGLLPIPGAKVGSIGLKIASEIARQKGFGHLPLRIKALSRNQVESILRGLGSMLASGGVSLTAAKKLFPTVKNITPTQMRALAAFRGRHMAGGGVSLAGGSATRLSMSGMGFGSGIKLAGQGVVGGRHRVLKKRQIRRSRLR